MFHEYETFFLTISEEYAPPAPDLSLLGQNSTARLPITLPLITSGHRDKQKLQPILLVRMVRISDYDT